MKTAASRIATALVVLALAAPALGDEVYRREHRQQQRIANGVKSGQLTPHETAHLERKEGRIHREVKRDRAANGGTLTPGEKAHVNAQQNRTSRQIHQDKHNDKVQ